MSDQSSLSPSINQNQQQLVLLVQAVVCESFTSVSLAALWKRPQHTTPPHPRTQTGKGQCCLLCRQLRGGHTALHRGNQSRSNQPRLVQQPQRRRGLCRVVCSCSGVCCVDGREERREGGRKARSMNLQKHVPFLCVLFIVLCRRASSNTQRLSRTRKRLVVHCCVFCSLHAATSNMTSSSTDTSTLLTHTLIHS